MSWERLPEDYEDQIWNGLKKYKQIDNSDGTISFTDVTNYSQREKSFFGAKEANRINKAVNYIMAKLENGTDLYKAFQDFFTEQKDLFIKNTETESKEFKSKTGEEFSQYQKYIKDLKEKSKDTLSDAEKEYLKQLAIYQDKEKAVFDMWFDNIKDKLSHDAAGKLQSEIDHNKEETTDTVDKLQKKIDHNREEMTGFVGKETIFENNKITEISENKKITTEFQKDKIIQNLYENDKLTTTKTITFEKDKIKEVIN